MIGEKQSTIKTITIRTAAIATALIIMSASAQNITLVCRVMDTNATGGSNATGENEIRFSTTAALKRLSILRENLRGPKPYTHDFHKSSFGKWGNGKWTTRNASIKQLKKLRTLLTTQNSTIKKIATKIQLRLKLNTSLLDLKSGEASLLITGLTKK